MRKSILAAALFAACTSVAQADIVGTKAGYNYWQTENHGTFQTVYAQLEHPIPLLPNAAVRYSTLDHDKLQFDSYDAYGYYEILDNSNIALDLGFGGRRFDSGKLREDSFSDTVPMVNADLTLFQDSTLSFYSKLDVGQGSDTSFNDLEVGARINLFAGLQLQGGYRTYELNLDDTKGINNDERIRGFNLGIHWDL